MNLQTNFFFDLPGNWFQDPVGKCLVDVPLVIINSNIRLLKVSNIPKHLQRVIERHTEVIQLVGSLKITHDHVKYKWKQ